jgi:hypothetical protein
MKRVDLAATVAHGEAVTIAVVEHASDRLGDEVAPSLIAVRIEDDAREIA